MTLCLGARVTYLQSPKTQNHSRHTHEMLLVMHHLASFEWQTKRQSRNIKNKMKNFFLNPRAHLMCRVLIRLTNQVAELRQRPPPPPPQNADQGHPLIDIPPLDWLAVRVMKQAKKLILQFSSSIKSCESLVWKRIYGAGASPAQPLMREK